MQIKLLMKHVMIMPQILHYETLFFRFILSIMFGVLKKNNTGDEKNAENTFLQSHTRIVNRKIKSEHLLMKKS